MGGREGGGWGDPYRIDEIIRWFSGPDGLSRDPSNRSVEDTSSNY